MFDLKFKDNWLSELGGVVEEQKKRKFAMPNIELVDIPGRSKKVVKDNLSYNSIELEEQIAFLPTLCKLNIAELGKRLSEWLIGTEYNQLYLDYMEGYFYNAIVTDISDLQVGNAGVMRTTVKFTCEPYMYSYAGQKVIDLSQATMTKPINIYNPESQYSYPIFFLNNSANQEVQLFFNNKAFNINSFRGKCIIDIENKNCTVDGKERNDLVSGIIWPTFKPGITEIKKTGNATLNVVPKWRRL